MLRILRTLALALCLPAASMSAPAHTQSPHTPVPGPVQRADAPSPGVTHAAAHAAAGSDTPEPASMALLGLGVLGLIACRRKV